MAAHQLDAMVSCSPENYAYATGFVVPSQPLIRHRHAMVIVGADAKVELFSVDMQCVAFGPAGIEASNGLRIVMF